MLPQSPAQNPNASPTDKQGYPHFMLQEIHAQPEVLHTCLSTYLPPDPSAPPLPCPPAQIHILASGTSRHAGLIAQYWLEQIAGIPTRVRSPSEFLSAPLPLTPNTLTIAITQSGETADTLAAAKHQKTRYTHLVDALPNPLCGITNHPHSTLATIVDRLLPTLAGTETGVAATKTFTAQLAVLACLSLELANQLHAIGRDEWQQLTSELRSLPSQIQTILEQQQSIQAIARKLASAKHCIVLGQGVNRAIALEGALKLKETTYIHAEGYAAGEFLHGPIALLEPGIPVIAILIPSKGADSAPDSTSEQVLATLRRVKSHSVPVIGITTTASHSQLFDHSILLPAIDERLSPFLTVIPLQLLAYYIALERGLNIDQPRNITKTVTSQ